MDKEYYVDLWTIRAVAGQKITLTVLEAARPYDLKVALITPSGVATAVMYAAAGVSLDVTPERTEDYTLSVGYTFPRYSRAYMIEVMCDCLPVRTLHREETLTDLLDESGDCNSVSAYRRLYDFDGEEGVPVRITAAAGHFNLRLEAQSEGADTGTFKLHSAAQPAFVFYPSATGPQRLWVSTQGDKFPTTFDLRIDDEPLEPCRRRAVRH